MSEKEKSSYIIVGSNTFQNQPAQTNLPNNLMAKMLTMMTMMTEMEMTMVEICHRWEEICHRWGGIC